MLYENYLSVLLCGYVHEGETAPEVCPKCKWEQRNLKNSARKMLKKYTVLIVPMPFTWKLFTLAEKMIALCKEGIEDNLDPKCVSAFTQAKDEAWVIKQRCKTELAGHMKLGKY